MLHTYRPEGLVINPVVYAELCFGLTCPHECDEVLQALDLRLCEIPRNGLFLAAQAFKAYKERHGSRRSVLPDFFIGGHAEATQMQVVTRDTGRLCSYFPEVSLIRPPPAGRPERPVGGGEAASQ